MLHGQRPATPTPAPCPAPRPTLPLLTCSSAPSRCCSIASPPAAPLAPCVCVACCPNFAPVGSGSTNPAGHCLAMDGSAPACCCLAASMAASGCTPPACMKAAAAARCSSASAANPECCRRGRSTMGPSSADAAGCCGWDAFGRLAGGAGSFASWRRARAPAASLPAEKSASHAWCPALPRDTDTPDAPPAPCRCFTSRTVRQ